MMKVLLILGVAFPLWNIVLTEAFAGLEPQFPLSASWGMTMEQVQKIPELDRSTSGSLQSSYLIRGVSQNEFVARWRGRTVSFYVARDFGLYAINIEMTPQILHNTPNAGDQELLDLEHCAPIRLAVMQKYGHPMGIAATWDTSEVSALSLSFRSFKWDVERESRTWSYARNWLIWEGQESRLALGEQSLWYVSRVGLAQRERKRLELEKERDLSLDRELERRAKHQQQIEEAREAVTSRAQAFSPLF